MNETLKQQLRDALEAGDRETMLALLNEAHTDDAPIDDSGDNRPPPHN